MKSAEFNLKERVLAANLNQNEYEIYSYREE